MSYQELFGRLEALEREVGNARGAAGDSRIDALEERLGALEDRVKALEKPSVQTEYPDASPLVPRETYEEPKDFSAMNMPRGQIIESETPATDAKKVAPHKKK